MPKYGQYDVPNADTMINFGTGQPNNLNLPIEWFQSTCKAMSEDMFGSNLNEHCQLLQYGAIEGYYDIRNNLSKWLTEKYYGNLDNSIKNSLKINNLITPEQLFMTNGNTGALHFLMSKYTESTDSIIVENPTYFIALNMFKEYGLQVEGINMDYDGINLVELEDKIKVLNSNPKYKQNVLFYYMIPTHHNPTGITTSHEKRKKLAELCDKYDNLYIIADEVYHFLTFDPTYKFYPMADYHPKMLSIGSFSKILAPGLRVGWLYQNTKLKGFKNEYGFVSGESGLNKSAVLDSSGGINPIGFKFIEYSLAKQSNGIRYIDDIINKHLTYLKSNCEIMLEFLGQFNNIQYIKPSGGYFLWVIFKTINNTTDFLKICEKNKVKFHPGIKFSTEKDFNNSIRLSFSYYNSNDLIIGLERLMDSVVKYNRINVQINGATGRLGSLIKKEILQNNKFNYVGDIKRTFSKAEFDGLSSYNSVIIDVSSNDGIFNLLTFLLNEKLYLSIIVGTTGLSSQTTTLINTYSKYAPIASISNFSEGIPLFRQFAKLANSLGPEWKFSMVDIHHVNKKDAPSGTASTIKNEIIRNVPIESVRTGEVIGTHTLSLTNGSELITITHNVENRDTFAKGCLNYIYWILTKPIGFYNRMNNFDDSHFSTYSYANNNIAVCELEKNIPESVMEYIVSNIISTNQSLNKVILIKSSGSPNDNTTNYDVKYNCNIYSVKNNTFNKINYCAYSLLVAKKYLENKIDGEFIVNNIEYTFDSDSTTGTSIIELPSLNYFDNKSKDESINSIINQMTNLTLFGVSRYEFSGNKYLILEIKDNVFDNANDMLETICTIINSEQPDDDKYIITFINIKTFHNNVDTNPNIIYLECFDSASNQKTSEYSVSCLGAIEYWLYHFNKNTKQTNKINIQLANNKQVNILYKNYHMYIYDQNEDSNSDVNGSNDVNNYTTVQTNDYENNYYNINSSAV